MNERILLVEDEEALSVPLETGCDGKVTWSRLLPTVRPDMSKRWLARST